MTADQDYQSPDSDLQDLEQMLYARHAEINSYQDLMDQRGTNIPALFNTFYKFIHNPSSVSVETFKRMVDTDDTIGSGVDFLTTCLAARLGKYYHKNPEITDWVQTRLNEIKGGWVNTIKQFLSATWAGFAVAEKVWANTENGFVPEKIVVLPPSTILFEAERTGELTKDGILQYQRNWNPLSLGLGIGYYGGALSVGMGFLGSSAQPDPFAKFGDLPFPMRTANSYNYLCIRIPTQKCMHYAFDAQGSFNNPYGRSLLRRAYKWWIQKDGYCRMLSVALDRKGTPLTVIYASQHTTLQDPDKIVGTTNQRGQRGIGIRADEAAHKAFTNVHNDSFVVLPGKKGEIFDLDFVPQDAHADQFMQAIDMCNKSMLRALLIPSLIFGNGDGSGSYSLGQEHSKTFLQILDGILQGLQEVLKEQLIREMLVYNFPEEMWKKDGVGEFANRDFSQEEQDKIVQMYDKAITAGIIDVNDLEDLNRMRTTIGFTERDKPIEKVNIDGEFDNPELNSTDNIEYDENGNILPSTNETQAVGQNDLADLALNGAQVSALLEVISNVVSGLLPQSSAIEIIHAAFPLIDIERIKRIISPIKVDKSIIQQPKKEKKNAIDKSNK